MSFVFTTEFKNSLHNTYFRSTGVTIGDDNLIAFLVYAPQGLTPDTTMANAALLELSGLYGYSRATATVGVLTAGVMTCSTVRFTASSDATKIIGPFNYICYVRQGSTTVRSNTGVLVGYAKLQIDNQEVSINIKGSIDHQLVLNIYGQAVDRDSLYTLAITNGYGSAGSLSRGSTAYINAEPRSIGSIPMKPVNIDKQAPSIQFFDGWGGDSNITESPRELSTTLIINKTPVSITAKYRIVDSWSVVQTTSEAINFSYYVPPNPRGLVVLLHRQGDTVDSWFSNTEKVILCNSLVGEGYGIVAYSYEGADWDTTSFPGVNVDLQNLSSLITTLQLLGKTTPTTRIFTLGDSSGGDFGTYANYYLNLKGAVVFFTPGLKLGGRTPILRMLTSRSTIVEDVQALNEEELGRGIKSSYIIKDVTPFFNERLTRLPNSLWTTNTTTDPTSPSFIAPYLTPQNSIDIVAALKTANILDANGFVIVDPSLNTWQASIPSTFSSYTISIGTQLNICYALESLYSDYSNSIVSFLLALPR